MDKLLIIDGNNLLFQMFYGMPSKIYNKNKETIHATIGFISYVLKQIKNYGITKCCVVFDYDTSTERIELCSEYKGNRVINWNELPQDEVPFNEEDKIIKCLNYLNIKVLHSKNMEADDLIASLTKLYEKNNEILISSFDSDFFQLINKNVSILRYRGKLTQIYDEEYFINKFGFEPSKYVLYKSIVGDTSDNICGVLGIGRVRATSLVNKYSSLEEMKLDNNENKYKNQVLLNDELVIRNIKLIKLKYHDSINYDINYFSFDTDKIKMTNSQILSVCDIF